MRSRLAALLLSFAVPVGLCLVAGRADAHAIVRETRPAADEVAATAPSSVTMRFNETVELAFGSLRVYDTRGRRVDRGEARHVDGASTVRVGLDDDLPDGTYTVTWHVVSADGHPIREAFVFHVGAPGDRPEGIARELLAGESGAGRWEGLLAGVARWALFGALLVLGGVVAFPLLVSSEAEQERRRLFAVAWAVALASTVVGFVVQGAVAGRQPLLDALSPEVLADVAGTRYGTVALARLALLGVLLVVRRTRVLAVVAVLAVSATPGLAGHAGTTSPVALNVAADVVHVAAAATWVGGLVVLLAWRRLDAGVVGRFSTVAGAAVAAVVASGLVRSWAEVRSLDALDERYGVLLLLKVGAVAAMVGFGFLNRRVLLPRQAERGRSLVRSMAAETTIAVVVLALTALLVNQAPARVTGGTDGPFETHVALGAHRVHVLVDPAEVGENAVHLTATTERGAPAPVESMQVLFRLPDADIGPLVADGRRLAPGHFVVQGRQLSQAGRWVVEIVAVTGRFEEARTRLTVPVRR
ncbi:MAG TPA: copper resistance protein CopC [Acidimicrobiales bacterium]|nr:copper resistance protein CopC [Acidimicrobiales bacterium]